MHLVGPSDVIYVSHRQRPRRRQRGANGFFASSVSDKMGSANLIIISHDYEMMKFEILGDFEGWENVRFGYAYMYPFIQIYVIIIFSIYKRNH